MIRSTVETIAIAGYIAKDSLKAAVRFLEKQTIDAHGIGLNPQTLGVDSSTRNSQLAGAHQSDRQVRVHDAITGEVLYEADAPCAVSCVRFHPNGRRLAIVGYDSLILVYIPPPPSELGVC